MTNFDYFIKRYRNKSLLIDTNLLILLLVGITNKGFIKNFKATKSYTEEDYFLLRKIIKHFRIITTSHVLSEASNLCEKADKYYKEKIFNSFSQIVQEIIEVPVSSKEITITPIFLKFGLTDSVLFHLSAKGAVVLTDDFELHGYLISNGAVAANMNLFRGEYLIKS